MKALTYHGKRDVRVDTVPDPTLLHATDAIINTDIHADMVFFETGNGGAVFSTGSIAYAGSLAWNRFDNNIFQISTNVLKRFNDPTPFEMPR